MYSRLVESLRSAYIAAEDADIEDQSLSKSINDIIIANYLGHRISHGGQGSDSYDDDGEYEYKCSTTDLRHAANFHCGSLQGNADANAEHVRSKFEGITGAFYAQLLWGEIQRIYYCPMEHLLPVLERKARTITKGQLNPNVSWDEFVGIEQSFAVDRSPDSTYPIVTRRLLSAMQHARQIGLEQGLFGKGGNNHLFLAQREGHRLADYGGGPDAFDTKGRGYEYKITMGDNFNFNFGARKSDEENEELIRRKCSSIIGAYCAIRKYGELTDIFYIPATNLERIIIHTFKDTDGRQLTKNFKPGQLERLGYRIYPLTFFQKLRYRVLRPLRDRKTQITHWLRSVS